RADAKAAWPKLLEAMALDAAGRFDDALVPDKERYVKVTNLATGRPTTMLWLGETSDMGFALPMFKEITIRRLVAVLDRSAVRMEPTQIEKKPEWKPGDPQ